MIGIIGAMQIEVERLVDKTEGAKKTRISMIDFTSGKICGKEVVIGLSGVGKVNAAICAQIMIDCFKVDTIINTGVAGGLADGLHQGDIVIANAFVQHDMDTSFIGDPKGFISGINVIELPAAAELIEKMSAACAAKGDFAVHRGLVATGDQFIGGELGAGIKKDFAAAACDMEGGAIAHVCYMAGVPFCAIRCISDNADGSAGVAYSEFAPIAAARCSELTTECIKLILDKSI